MRRAPSNRAVFCFAAGRVFSLCHPDRSPRSGGTPAFGRARQWSPPSLRTRCIQSSSLCFESLCVILERSEESRSLKLVSERRFDYYLARVSDVAFRAAFYPPRPICCGRGRAFGAGEGSILTGDAASSQRDEAVRILRIADLPAAFRDSG